MVLAIKNKAEVDSFFRKCMKAGHDMVSIKGQAPAGATYSDGDPITRRVAVAWKCIQTGETVRITY